MKIKLRPYQEKALSKLGTSGVQVLSICPGGGKTFTALEYVKRNANKFKKILILAHGTNLLKTQWAEEMNNKNIRFTTDIDGLDNIKLAIPQALKNKKIPRFDLIIVDEAHEFYFAEKMVKTIISKANPKCQLLLTGTPSKLIKAGFKPVIVSGVEVYADGYLTDTYFGLVTSSYNLSLDAFNQKGDKKESAKLSKQNTIKSLESLVKEMINRLNDVGFLKGKPNLRHVANHVSAPNFRKAFGALDKTLIAAYDIEQATHLHSHLQKNGVTAVLSDSISDMASEKIAEFLSNPEIQVLVVVRRGVLGFNMPELVNVVDFTMSRNIDRVYQLYARVLRKHDDYDKKFYFRICSAINPQVDAFAVQAAMCLNNPSFISKYNGTNLNEIDILVPARMKRNVNGNRTGAKQPGKKATRHSVDPIMADQVLSLELLKELTVTNNSKSWKEFAYMKYGEVVTKLTGKEFHRQIVNITEENLLWMIKYGKVDGRIYG